jgi:hypothetical protein
LKYEEEREREREREKTEQNQTNLRKERTKIFQLNKIPNQRMEPKYAKGYEVK